MCPQKKTFVKNHAHPLIMKLRQNTLRNLTTGDSTWRQVILQKEYWLFRNYARTVLNRFWLGSSERLNIQSLKMQALKLTWIVLIPGVIKTVCLLNVQCNLINIACMRVDGGFSGVIVVASSNGTLLCSQYSYKSCKVMFYDIYVL